MKLKVEIPFEEVRRYLSRAIGSFLFDDCEVPSLVSVTGDEDSILVRVGEAEEDVEITSLIPFSHALWGDPLLEALFVDDPSPTFLEAYGGSPIVFARQRTKRMWYTFFTALMIVLQAEKGRGIVPASLQDSHNRLSWARDTIVACVEKLKNAPCY